MTLLTEEDAKAKWCPFGPTHHTPGLDGIEVDVAKSRSRCIGRACMAWRWQSSLTVMNASRIPGHGQQITREHGYCGLAGRPS